MKFISLNLISVLNSFIAMSLIAPPTLAQVVSDGTVSTTVHELNNGNIEITGGQQAGSNLFHSFEQFSIPTEITAEFLNANTIENIISRVTGEFASQIEGVIAANGTANLILINPNGITFGENATLNIGGSFMATTAERIKFADGTVYSTTNTAQQPLLTVTAPIGLGFGRNPGMIENFAGRLDPSQGLTPVDGLRVSPAETLALVGGNIQLEGGLIVAPGGRAELGAVAGNSQVGITTKPTGWELDYKEVTNFRDIQLFSRSSIVLSDTRDPTDSPTSSSAQLQGKQIKFEESNLGATNRDQVSSGLFFFHARESLTLDHVSILTVATLFGDSNSGDILITTPRLQVLDDSIISTASVFSNGTSGNITLEIAESIRLDGQSIVFTETFNSAGAGNITINTQQLQILNGSRISSSVREGAGNAGRIDINATESIIIDGSVFDPGPDPNLVTLEFSRITADATTATSVTGEIKPSLGDAGIVTIATGNLTLTNGGQVSVSVLEQGEGEAGALAIDADTITVIGENSGIFGSSVSPESAGNLTINTNALQVAQGGAISVTATGTGDAGNLDISANLLQLQQGQLSADTQAGQGNIFLSTQDLRLRNHSNIQTNAFGSADGGNITITTDTLTLLEKSHISANAEQGLGGRVMINTQGLFLSPDSSITASSERGEAFAGVVEINSPNQEILGSVNIESQFLAEPQIYQQCTPSNAQSRFISSRRGGMTATGQDIQGETSVREDLALPTQIVEAQGWVMNDQGETVLTPTSPFRFQSLCIETGSSSLPTSPARSEPNSF